MTAAFVDVAACWVCGSATLNRTHDAIMDLDIYRTEHPALAEYTGDSVWFRTCAACGFTQPERLPALPRFFDFLYDQLWSADWVRREFESTYKDLIFTSILGELAARRPPGRRILDIGAHAGRFLHLARDAGWQPEGIELNPRTAAYAAERTGLPVYSENVDRLVLAGHCYGGVTLTDVLEHIPEPLRLLARVRDALVPGGWIAVKVPSGPAQRFKEGVRARLRHGYRPRLADNLVHVNHFTPSSLRLALERAGFDRADVRVGAPELPDHPGIGTFVSNLGRRGLYRAGSLLPGGVHTPLALNLQAYARRPQ
jgi:SAM-dependent methyltransferase